VFTGGHDDLPAKLSDCSLDAKVICGDNQLLKGGCLGGTLVNVLDHRPVMDQDQWLAGKSLRVVTGGNNSHYIGHKIPLLRFQCSGFSVQVYHFSNLTPETFRFAV
jgi:hypothetical protein